MPEPPDQMPAAAIRGDFRASHTDREHAIGTLKTAFVQGRLAKGEFDQRVGQVLASRTCAELAVVTADLPAGLTTAQPPKPARAPGKRHVLRQPGPVLTAATVLYAGMWPLSSVLPTESGGDHNPTDGINLVGAATLVYMLVLISICLWAQARGSWRERRSGGQLPGRPAPGAGGQAPRRLPSADPGRPLPPADPGHRHIAQAARRHLPRLPLPGRGHCADSALAAGTAPARG